MATKFGIAIDREELPYVLQEIINENKSTPFLLNPYFRLQKNDAESRKKYKNTSYGREVKNRKLKILLQIPYLITRITVFSVVSLLYIKQVNFFNTTKVNAETLFVSHATKTNLDAKNDLFFGDLLKLFNKKNYTVIY